MKISTFKVSDKLPKNCAFEHGHIYTERQKYLRGEMTSPYLCAVHDTGLCLIEMVTGRVCYPCSAQNEGAWVDTTKHWVLTEVKA